MPKCAQCSFKWLYSFHRSLVVREKKNRFEGEKKNTNSIPGRGSKNFGRLEINLEICACSCAVGRLTNTLVLPPLKKKTKGTRGLWGSNFFFFNSNLSLFGRTTKKSDHLFVCCKLEEECSK